MPAEKKKIIQLVLFILVVLALIPLTPVLRSPQGQSFLRVFVPLLYAASCLFLTVLLFRIRKAPGCAAKTIAVFILMITLSCFVYKTEILVEKIHYIQYMGLYAMCLRVFPQAVRSRYILALAISASIGIADETIQIFLPKRYFDIADISKNIQGCLFGMMFSVILRGGRGPGASGLDSRRGKQI